MAISMRIIAVVVLMVGAVEMLIVGVAKALVGAAVKARAVVGTMAVVAVMAMAGTKDILAQDLCCPVCSKPVEKGTAYNKHTAKHINRASRYGLTELQGFVRLNKGNLRNDVAQWAVQFQKSHLDDIRQGIIFSFGSVAGLNSPNRLILNLNTALRKAKTKEKMWGVLWSNVGRRHTEATILARLYPTHKRAEWAHFADMTLTKADIRDLRIQYVHHALPAPIIPPRLAPRLRPRQPPKPVDIDIELSRKRHPILFEVN